MQQHESGSLFGAKRRERGSLKRWKIYFSEFDIFTRNLKWFSEKNCRKKHCYSITKTEIHLLIFNVTETGWTNCVSSYQMFKIKIVFFSLMNVHFLSILIIPWLSKNLTKYKGHIFSVIGRNSIVVVKIRQIYSQHDDKNHYQKSSSFLLKNSPGLGCLLFNRFYRQIVIEEICYFSNFAQEF